MTTRECIDITRNFLEVRHEYLEVNEILRNLNTAQIAVVKDHFYNQHKKRSQYNEPPSAFEHTQYDSSSFTEIIEHFDGVDPPYLYLNNKGQVSYNAISARFPFTTIRGLDGELLESRKCQFFHMASFMWQHEGKWRKIRWERHNDMAQIENDPFFNPTEKYPVYTQNKNWIQVYPKMPKILRATIVREPKFIWLDETNATKNVNPELPNEVMYDVIFRALALAGVQIRDVEFSRMIQQHEQMQ